MTFWLSAPLPLVPEDDTETIVPQGQEVATWASDEEPEIVFTTDERLVIAPPRLTQLRREVESLLIEHDRQATDGVAVAEDPPAPADD